MNTIFTKCSWEHPCLKDLSMNFLFNLSYSYLTTMIQDNFRELGFSVISVMQKKRIKRWQNLAVFSSSAEETWRQKKSSCWRLCYVIISVKSIIATSHHFSRECSLPSTCCKCSSNHHSKECTVVMKENPAIQPIWNNCGLNHVTSYKGCKAYPMKPQFHKRFTEAVKSKKKRPSIHQRLHSKMPRSLRLWCLNTRLKSLQKSTQNSRPSQNLWKESR